MDSLVGLGVEIPAFRTIKGDAPLPPMKIYRNKFNSPLYLYNADMHAGVYLGAALTGKNIESTRERSDWILKIGLDLSGVSYNSFTLLESMLDSTLMQKYKENEQIQIEGIPFNYNSLQSLPTTQPEESVPHERLNQESEYTAKVISDGVLKGGILFRKKGKDAEIGTSSGSNAEIGTSSGSNAEIGTSSASNAEIETSSGSDAEIKTLKGFLQGSIVDKDGYTWEIPKDTEVMFRPDKSSGIAREIQVQKI